MVPCAKSRDQLKQFEEDKEDCFIIEFDPDEAELEFSKLSLTHTSDADLTVVAQKGKIACRDYPHPRHLCAKYPFGKTPDESHCDQCYCYVCDFAAPCKKWAGKSKHCKAFDTDWWKIKRQLRRESVERKKEAFKDFEHPRHMCVKYPFEQTPHDTHCELCRCYVCGSAAPCKEWVGTSGHCHAFNNQKWRTKRELKGQAELQKEQSEPGSGVSITAGKQVQSNVVLQEDQPQEAQRSQTDLGGSVGGESTGDLSDESQVYVENLPHDMTTHNLASLFEEVGVVKKAKVVISWKNKFGVVTMGSKVEAEKAVAMFNGYTLKGNVLIVRVREVNRKRTYTADCSCSLFTGYTAQVYVDNLPHDVTRQDLVSLFKEVGVVKKAELKYSNDTSRVGLVTPGRNYTNQVGLVTPGRNDTSRVGLVTGGRNDTSRVNDMSQVGLVTGGRRVGLVSRVGLVTGGRRVGLVTPGRNDTSRVGIVTPGRNDTSQVGLVTGGRNDTSQVNDMSQVGLVTPGRNDTSRVGIVTPGRNDTSLVGLVTGGRNDTSRVNDMSQVGLVTGGRRVGLVTPGRNDTSRVGIVTPGRNDTSQVGLVAGGRNDTSRVNDTSQVGIVTPGRNDTSRVGIVTPGRNDTSRVGLVTCGRNDTSRVNDMSQVGLVTGGRRVGLVTPGRNDTSRVGIVTPGRNDTSQVGLVTSGRNDTTRVGLVTPGRKIIALVTMGSILEAEKAVAMFNRNTLKGNVLSVRQLNRSGGLLFPKRAYTADGFYSIYVGNLSQKVDNQRLEGLFIDHDFKPLNARIILDRLTKQSRGFGFVVVESLAERDDAVLTLDGYILDGRLLKLREANY